MDVYVEPVRPEPKVVVFGAGHVGKAVAHLAGWLGFRVVVADDRKGFATESDVPEAERRLTCALEELPDRLDIDEQTYLILTTRGVPVDAAGLPALLESPAGYIGVIGSRRRWETTVQELVEAGVEKEKLRRVTSPMGLELNAETPEEIALSIMAEIVMLRRSGTGEKMAHLPKSLRASK
jgi:xanthine dehydrogenase accessory factor